MLFFSTIFGINKRIDRFMADRYGMVFQLHSPGNLLRRPSLAYLPDHTLTELINPDELALLWAILAIFLVGNLTIVTGKICDLIIDKLIAFKFTEYGLTMSSKLLGNDVNRELCRAPTIYFTPFNHINMRIGAFHLKFLAYGNPLVSFTSCTSN